MPESESAPAPGIRWAKVGWIILGISMLFWAFLPAIPFLPVTAGKKAIVGGITFILAEVTFWAGALIVGKETLRKYQDRLSPKSWITRRKE